MILPRLMARYLRHGDDVPFYELQAADAVRWITREAGVSRTGMQVLDIGCGHGVLGRAWEEAGRAVSYADLENHLLPDLADRPFYPVNLDAAHWPDLGRYDLVLCSNVLEHLARPRAFLERAPGLLRPGGRLYLSWTNWLSPWGGHEFSPWHYLGPRLGPAIHDRLGGRRFHRPGENLFVTHVGRVLRWIREDGRLRVVRAAPRYYTELAPLVRVPLLREFLCWNVALLLEATPAAGSPEDAPASRVGIQ